MDAHILM